MGFFLYFYDTINGMKVKIFMCMKLLSNTDFETLLGGLPSTHGFSMKSSTGSSTDVKDKYNYNIYIYFFFEVGSFRGVIT